MRSLVIIVLSWLATSEGTLYGFYRSMDKKASIQGTRRVFGGAKANLKDFPRACLLIDRYWSVRCSGAVVAPRWILTAAHCVESTLAYVKFNTRSPGTRSGDSRAIVALYRHPEFNVKQENEGRGADVTQLYHDIGLAETSQHMILQIPVPVDPLTQARRILPEDLKKLSVKVMGFGRTETPGSLGEELFTVSLHLQPCERSSWVYCVCGISGPGERASGVCSGDSGGPVVYEGTQVGVTSMGPLDCVTKADISPSATSVFTALYHYVDIVNATIHGLAAAPRFKQIPLSSQASSILLSNAISCCVKSLTIAFGTVLLFKNFVK